MVPLVETREQAEMLVAACRYRPEGRRGLGFSVAHDDYTGRRGAPKIQAANDAILTIALIESARGIENADAILSVPGLDLGWLGHYDLSDSMGFAGDFDDPRYRAPSSAARGRDRGGQAAGLARARRRRGAQDALARGIPVHLHRAEVARVAKCAGAGVRACAQGVAPAAP